MIDFKSWIITTLSADTTLQNLGIKDSNGNMNIFPVDVDISPEQFPAVIFQDVGVSILSRPQGMHVGRFQLSIMSIASAIQVENIYDRVAFLLNFKDSTSQVLPNGATLWWIREDDVRDMHDSTRRMWRKTVTLKFWMSKSNNT